MERESEPKDERNHETMAEGRERETETLHRASPHPASRLSDTTRPPKEPQNEPGTNTERPPAPTFYRPPYTSSFSGSPSESRVSSTRWPLRGARTRLTGLATVWSPWVTLTLVRNAWSQLSLGPAS